MNNGFSFGNYVFLYPVVLTMFLSAYNMYSTEIYPVSMSQSKLSVIIFGKP